MILTDRLAYVHVPHTGGSWVESVLLARGGEMPGYQHEPGWLLEPAWREKRDMVASVRHPATWYAACWAFCERLLSGELALTDEAVVTLDEIAASVDCYSGGTRTRRDVLYGMTHLHEVSELPPLCGLTWGNVYPRGLFDLDSVGLYTFAVTWHCAGGALFGEQRDGVDYYLHQESLTQDLADALGVSVDDLRRFERKNVSKRPHAPWSDEELGWIWAADGRLASRLGYQRED